MLQLPKPWANSEREVGKAIDANIDNLGRRFFVMASFEAAMIGDAIFDAAFLRTWVSPIGFLYLTLLPLPLFYLCGFRMCISIEDIQTRYASLNG